MKRKNFKRKIFSCIAIWSVFIGSLLLYSPDSNATTASGAPEISITTPNDNSVFNVSTVEFTGSVTDDVTTPDKLSITVLEQQGNPESPVNIDISNEGKLTLPSSADSSEFKYSKDFSQGKHTLIFRVTDENGNSTNLTWTITVNYVTEMNLFKDINDQSSYLDASKSMTEVPLDYKVRLVLNDDSTTQTSQPVLKIQSTNGKDVPVNAKLEKTNTLEKTLVYTFTPTTNLDPKTAYYVYLNPNSANLDLVPKLFKFTTMSNENTLPLYQFESDPTVYNPNDPNSPRQPDYIHGKYSDVTNSCAYCHSTHKGTTEKLQGGKYGSTHNNLCMACHDGTVSVAVDVKSSSHQPDPTKSDQTSTCTTCHDPHFSWDKDNPNLLKQDQLTVQ